MSQPMNSALETVRVRSVKPSVDSPFNRLRQWYVRTNNIFDHLISVADDDLLIGQRSVNQDAGGHIGLNVLKPTKVFAKSVTHQAQLGGHARAGGARGFVDESAELRFDIRLPRPGQPAARAFEFAHLRILIEDLARMDLADE